jgi:hypothetical protein
MAAMKMHTFVPDQPSLKAISCANSSPNPNIKPFMNGSTKLMAAPLSKPHIEGGSYNMSGEPLEEEGAEETWLFDS